MSRAASLLVVVVLVAAVASCTKAATQDGPSNGGGKTGGDKVAVPGGNGGGAGKVAVPGGNPEMMKGGNDGVADELLLAPDEGHIEVSTAEGAAGAEAIVKVAVKAADKFKVNIEFPSKLSLTAASGVAIAKAELKAGGHDKEKGDAEVFDDHQLQFLVKLTPADKGNFTVNGVFKFAVCDKAGSQCLPKKMPIAIQVAAK
ncbi:MAG: hypothetical protein KF773_35420 [Deltaproteobacteria bacterium]|nr:hypothetical protein [Deltaproteobacteria bacterium]